MSRTINPLLQAHLSGECTTLATCCKITLRNGTVLAFTEHDNDIIVSGITYKAALGYERSQIGSTADLAVDQTEIDAVIDDDSIEESALALGAFDGAKVELFMLNWADPSMGTLILMTGVIGEVTSEGNRYRAEIRSLTQRLQQTIGRAYMPECDVQEFGDSRCKVNVASYRTTSAVDSVSTDRMRWSDSALTADSRYYTGGKVTWTSGANSGYTSQVAYYATGDVLLVAPTPYPIAAGDAYQITAGCDRRLSTCRDRFNNLVNFRGFPHIPGSDALMRVGR